MKKLFAYTLLSLFTLGFSSCLRDDKQLFDSSPATRLDAIITQEKQLLESSPQGWMLQYYAGKDYTGAGYTLLMKFENGKVSIMGDNGDPELIATSDYDIVKDQGPVLTFPTFNAVIHPLASASLGHPEGIQGDYEFVILETSQDRIRLRGKKWKNEMTLTRLPEGSSFEELMASMLNIREGMTSNTYHFLLGTDTLAQGEVNVDSRHLTVTLGDVSYDTPYTISPTGLILQKPLSISGKNYMTFKWNEEKKEFTEGDLSIRLYVPATHKPIDFWYGTWTLRHDPVPGQGRRPTLLELAPGSRPNSLEGKLTFIGKTYTIRIIPYDPATGTIRLIGQPITDPTHTYAGGIILFPVSHADGNKLLNIEHSITFTWDEDQQQALADGSEEADGKVDSFFGAAYGADLQPLLGANGQPIFPISLPNIQSIRKRN